MDDNKVLTLVSNARIPVTDSMRFLFEVSNLDNATLATVTRGGVLFINSTDIGWKPFMESWLDRAHQSSNNSTQNKIYRRAVRLDNMAHTVFIRQFERFFGEGYKSTFSSKKINYVAP